MYEKAQRKRVRDMTGNRGYSPVLLLSLTVTQKVDNHLDALLEDHVQQV